MATHATNGNGVASLGQEDFAKLLDKRARERFNMTLDQFIDAVESGRLADTPEVMDIAVPAGANPR